MSVKLDGAISTNLYEDSHKDGMLAAAGYITLAGVIIGLMWWNFHNTAAPTPQDLAETIRATWMTGSVGLGLSSISLAAGFGLHKIGKSHRKSEREKIKPPEPVMPDQTETQKYVLPETIDYYDQFPSVIEADKEFSKYYDDETKNRMLGVVEQVIKLNEMRMLIQHSLLAAQLKAKGYTLKKELEDAVVNNRDKIAQYTHFRNQLIKEVEAVYLGVLKQKQVDLDKR